MSDSARNNTARDAFRAAVESEDLDRAMALMTDAVVLGSPVTFKPYAGQVAVRRLLEIVFRTFEDFRYTDELVGDDAAILAFAARVGDKTGQGIDLIRTDASGRICELTVMVRPLSFAIALAQNVGPALAQAEDPAGA